MLSLAGPGLVRQHGLWLGAHGLSAGPPSRKPSSFTEAAGHKPGLNVAAPKGARGSLWARIQDLLPSGALEASQSNQTEARATAQVPGRRAMGVGRGDARDANRRARARGCQGRKPRIGKHRDTLTTGVGPCLHEVPGTRHKLEDLASKDPR